MTPEDRMKGITILLQGAADHERRKCIRAAENASIAAGMSDDPFKIIEQVRRQIVEAIRNRKDASYGEML